MYPVVSPCLAGSRLWVQSPELRKRGKGEPECQFKLSNMKDLGDGSLGKVPAV